MTDLGDTRVFLSASFPSGERGERFLPYDPAAISDAVTAVARAVLLAGGHLVFGAHPTISPLVLLVAGDLHRPRAVDIFQSEIYRDNVPIETWRLADLGLGDLRFVAPDPSGDRAVSLDAMRREMLADDRIAAGVFIGGMDGILDEYRMLAELRPNAARLPLLAPGGAARQLAPGDDPVSVRVARWLGSDRYPAVAHEIVAALDGSG